MLECISKYTVDVIHTLKAILLDHESVLDWAKWVKPVILEEKTVSSPTMVTMINFSIFHILKIIIHNKIMNPIINNYDYITWQAECNCVHLCWVLYNAIKSHVAKKVSSVTISKTFTTDYNIQCWDTFWVFFLLTS